MEGLGPVQAITYNPPIVEAPLSPADIPTVRESFLRAELKGDVLRRFYELFLGTHPEVKEKFRSVDLDRQVETLRESLEVAIFHSSGHRIAQKMLAEIRASHGPGGLGVSADHYRLWRDTLVQSVAEFDPLFDESLEATWNAVLQPTIDFMTFGSDAPPDDLSTT